ncbi:L,D-transpeptidase [uncultured Eudoraea sp.]|uniref:L,D-transpeptidase n=1 Tax=uncultured Eudoraea sp. TaxID=1035614 RepID=UPI0026340B52|nr:L,D-transpeptidase [uncultured Eudoraea sp.]
MTLKPVVLFGIFMVCISVSVKPAFSSNNWSEAYQTGIVEHARDSTEKLNAARWIRITRDIKISEYFEYMDSLVNAYDSLVPYPLSEHLLVRANPWIIDTLANTDYYRMTARDSFVYDQRKLFVLRPSDSIMIPDSLSAAYVMDAFKKTYLDVNIPEFKLRIYQDTSLLYTFSVRVGKNAKKYLAMGDKITDLRTITGKGKIIRLVRNPEFYNPVTLKRFYLTKRDDDKTTLMPQIPWIETEINGIRNGQMIHPTTNPKTLGNASSNGCIGTRESDAWIIYYYAPPDTAISIRYDLEFESELSDKAKPRDIYGYEN